MSPAHDPRFETVTSPDPHKACGREVMIDFVARIADNRFRTELRLVTKSWLIATMSVFQDENGLLHGTYLSVAYKHVGIR
jgi:hypothetical protein